MRLGGRRQDQADIEQLDTAGRPRSGRWFEFFAMVEAAGIEPDPAYFEKRRRRATFVVNSMKGKGFGSNSLSS